MLRERKTHFVIALNKIDRILDWKSINDRSSYVSFKDQDDFSKNRFKELLKNTVGDLII